MNIAYKPSDLSGVGSYRLLQPMRELAGQYGWNCQPFPRRDTELPGGRTGRTWSTKTLPCDADLIVLQREMNLAMAEQTEEWQRQGRVVVLELDDDLSCLSPTNPSWRGSHPDPRVRYGRPTSTREDFLTFAANRDNLWEIAKAVDAVTVTTPALARRYESIAKRTIILPNFIDDALWKNISPPQWERLRIGYMGVSEWHREDLEELRGIIGPFLEAHPHVDFVAAGDETIHDLLNIPEGQRISYERTAYGDHVALTAAMDIALVPLTLSAFNQAKSYLKGLEANACGIPFIASPTEPYRAFVQDGAGGVIAKRGHDWVRHLSRLIADDDERKSLGAKGRAKAAEMTIQRNAHLWREAYESLRVRAKSDKLPR